MTEAAGAATRAPDERPYTEGALCVGERLRRSVEAESEGTGGLGLAERLTMSVGVALLADGVDAAGFVEAADAALYRAKALGTNRVLRRLAARSLDGAGPTSGLRRTLRPAPPRAGGRRGKAAVAIAVGAAT